MSTAPAPAPHELEDWGRLDPDWAGIRTEWVEVAGARTRLLRTDGDPDGPLVLCVHGLGGSSPNWLEVLRPLSAIGDVVAVDLPGFGETVPPRPTASRPPAAARFLAALLTALDRGPALVIGNSMGGLVSTLLAADHPELVRGLVLLGPALPPRLVGLVPSKLQVSSFGPFLLPVFGPWLMRRRIQRLSFEEQYRAMMQGLAVDPDRINPNLVDVGVANLSRVKELRWRGAAFSEATASLFEHQVGPSRPRTIRAMERVEAPTLYLRGSEDALVLSATTEQVRRTRPDWTVEELDAIGHIPMIEDATGVVDRITAWAAETGVT